MSFDSPSAGPGPRWTGDGSLRPRIAVPEDDPASPAHRSFREAFPARMPRPRTVEVGGVAAILASPLRRLVALAVDRLIVSMLLTFLLRIAGIEPDAISIELLAAAQILTRGWEVIFFTQGWTPGSRLMGIRIVRVEDGAAPGVRRGVLRAAGAVISETVLVGYLWAFWDPRQQTWQDKIAGTVVVDIPR